MTPFLLSSQTVLDIAKKQNLPAERWLEAATSRGIYEEDICISAVVPMTVMHTIEQQIAIARKSRSTIEPTVASLGIVKTNAQRFITAFHASDRIVPMDHLIAGRWGDLLNMELVFTDEHGVTYEVGSSEKIELATASVGRDGLPFVYVDRAQITHSTIPNLDVECPVRFAESLKS